MRGAGPEVCSVFHLTPEETRLVDLVRQQSCYRLGAYEFVQEAVFFASRVVFATGTHVSGQQLLQAVRRLARERYGALAREVFEQWGIRTTEDVGTIVFQLVETGILSKTEEDSLEDFRDGYDLDTAFSADDYWAERLTPTRATTPPRATAAPDECDANPTSPAREKADGA